MIRKMAVIGTVLTVCLSGCAAVQTAEKTVSEQTEGTDVYNGLFDTSYVHTVDVTISDEDWEDLKTNPLDKTKYEATVVIDGETVENVSFATKGNTSLSSVASDPDSDRYSFKINFGKFVDGQTYYGLDKLNLNNLYSDATYMKDFLSYTIFREAGIDCSLVSYVWLTVNGEDAGLYIAVEEVGDSYLARTQDSAGELYKPETEQLDNAGGMGQDMQMPGMNTEENTSGMPQGEMPDQNAQEGGMPQDGNMQMPGMNGGQGPGGMMPDENMQMPDGNTQMPDENMQMPEDMQGGMGEMNGMQPGMSQNDSGASLVYTDDELSSYTDIFDNAETDVTEEDEQRVVEALKKLSEGDTSGLNTEEIIRYFAAHNFVMNYDSYTGNMLHNYYLYENSGKLSILPWDYNLAFGAFMNQGGGTSDATSIINMGIDSPLSGTTEESRPAWAWIAASEEYTEQYHQVYDELLSSFFESGECEALMETVYEMIRPYVEKDPTAFYTAEEFDAAYETLKEFVSLRTQSIRRQLNGELSTVTDEQNASDRIDASSLDISVMGIHNGGGMGGNEGMPNGNTGMPGMPQQDQEDGSETEMPQ